MAKYYKHTTQSPLLFQMKRNNLTQSNVSTMLGISDTTLRTWINDPTIMQIKDLLKLSGLFGMPIEELVYIIVRAKPQLIGQLNKSGSWYIEDIRERNK